MKSVSHHPTPSWLIQVCGFKDLCYYTVSSFHQLDLIIALNILCSCFLFFFLNSVFVISGCPMTAVIPVVLLKLQRLLKRDVGDAA